MSTANAPAALSAALADRYRIDRELGAGGMATVYLAHDLKHERPVALKVLRPELAAVIGAERFLTEIKVTANLQHPHILPLHDSGEAGGFLYYVMPFIEGESLRDRLTREQQLPVTDAVRITGEVASALDYAHRQGVVHRDIKPENILLHDGRALVADFGIALAASRTAGARMTETGMSLGTPTYMSPEQAMGEREITARSDVYALGCVAYELLAGEPPFTGPTAQAIVARVMTERPRALRAQRATVPPHVEAAIQTALEKLPADRFPTVAAFATALADPSYATAASTVLLPAASADASAGRARVGGARRAVFTVATVLGAIALGGGAGWLARAGRTPTPSVVRFPLTVPAGLRLAEGVLTGESFAISPDGRTVVMAVTYDSGADRRARLYVRTLDQLEGAILPGTEAATSPFFSPDGKWIGFFTGTGRTLKKVAVAGGPPITLADGTSLRQHGSWTAEGEIVFSNASRQLVVMSAAGGRITPVPVKDSVASYYWAEALPDSPWILSMYCPRGCGTHDLVVVHRETGERRAVIPGATRGWYLPIGVLVYGTDEGAVFGVPFDPVRATTSGEPIPLVEDVQLAADFGTMLTLSASGEMAYVPLTNAGTAQIVAVGSDGSERTVLDRSGAYANPRWAPDGKRIALDLRSRNGTQVWVYDLGSQTMTQLTRDGENVRPAWSPDGLRIAFSGSNGVMWMPADGSGPPEPVMEGAALPGTTAISWTRDGAFLIVDGLPPVPGHATREDVFAVSTVPPRALESLVSTPANDQVGIVSPDGQWLAYVSDESESQKVYVRPFRRPGGRFLISTGAGEEPLWAGPASLLYVDPDAQALMRAELTMGTAVDVTHRTLVRDLRPYTTGSAGWWNYDVTRDGRDLLFVKPARAAESASPIVVLNWFEEVRARSRPAVAP